MEDTYNDAALLRHAAMYGVEKREGETDESLRSRVVAEIHRQMEEIAETIEVEEGSELVLPMERLSTIQKRNNLNSVWRTGEPGPGGAYHDYEIYPDVSDPAEQYEIPLACIEFQRGARKDPEARHGVLDNDLLEIVRDRLKFFQAGDYATRENEIALMHVECALLWLNKRVEDRAERNVLGTMQK